MIAINAYDEYGIPAPTNSGRFGYTGQIWLPDLKLWYYKARMYSPTRGRFLQTDPIGYADGMNWYDYVGGDPVNKTDPSGMATVIIVTAKKNIPLRYLHGSFGRSPQSLIEEKRANRPGMECDKMCEINKEVMARLAAQKNISADEGIADEGPGRKDDVSKDWCGAEGSEFVPDVNFSKACRKHDICYATKGKSKEACDIELSKNIIGECMQNSHELTGCIAASIIYSGSLIILGFDLGEYCTKLGCINIQGPSRKEFNNARRDRQ